VGDYFYEDGQEQTYPRADQAVRWTGLQPATETLTLRDYRLRHALTRTDVDLQAVSEAAPLIAVWDDHEITNDPWVGGAQAHNPENGEGDWWVRKRAAVKAYHEWMPTRIEPPPACTTNAASVAASAAEISMCTGTHEGERIYRQFRFGTLAALFMLETRLLARAEQAFDG
jgi:phosphodiesterase/alkaline phosphatase D-like protein